MQNSSESVGGDLFETYKIVVITVIKFVVDNNGSDFADFF